MTIKSDRWIKQQCTPPVTMAQLSMPSSDWESQYVENLTGAKQPEGSVYITEPEETTDPDFLPMIEPFVAEQIRTKEQDGQVEKLISYGNSSYGYDARCSDEFKIFTNINSAVVDPKNFSEDCLVDHKGPYCIIPPNSFALARTVEYFRIPEDVLVVCLGKSTYARCGIIVNVTPLEPGWEGHVTLEFSNTTNLPAKVYANEGVCQFLFFQSDERCEVSYKDRGGKYMGQRGVTNPRM